MEILKVSEEDENCWWCKFRGLFNPLGQLPAPSQPNQTRKDSQLWQKFRLGACGLSLSHQRHPNFSGWFTASNTLHCWQPKRTDVSTSEALLPLILRLAVQLNRPWSSVPSSLNPFESSCFITTSLEEAATLATTTGRTSTLPSTPSWIGDTLTSTTVREASV